MLVSFLQFHPKLKTLVIGSLGSLFTLGFISSVQAGSVSGATKATATLAGSCLLSAPDVSFGTYVSNQSSPTLASQNVSIQCTKGTSYSFNETRVSNGLASWSGANGQSVVEMSNNSGNGDVLMIQVYNPVSASWVDDINFPGGGVNAIQGVGTGTNQNINLSFRILPGQYVTPGGYTATYTASVTY
jgi:spore coat protein U-like protein